VALVENNFLAQIPYGTKDFLPRDAKRKRLIDSKLGKLFASWGYDEVVTPTFEYLDTVTIGIGGNLAQNSFKFLDKNNRLLALRPDMTTPLARLAVTRLKDFGVPLRLCYLANVFRYEQAQAGRQCEFFQGGVELMGVPEPTADAEVIALAIKSLLETGLLNFQISLGQVDFIQGIMGELELSVKQQQLIKACITSRNLVGLQEVVANSGLSVAAQQLLQQIPVLHGKEELLERAGKMAPNATSRAALANLAEIYQLLQSYRVEQYVNFDLGIIRDFDYYTGMVFEGYTPGLGFPLCGGGRYDNLLAAYGSNCPATGFALGIDRVLLALDRQGIKQTADGSGVYIGWQAGRLAEAIEAADNLRANGQAVELSLVSQERDTAAKRGAQRGLAQFIYFGE
jgi:ATP phosphoribosyltransferase regulatory subunit